jgi:imidazole glycerol-phosphate synthase subunit HisF
MKYIRIIPRLDIKGPNLVKGIHLEGLRVLGKPEDFAKLYYEQGADELIFHDTVASLYNRNNLTEIITRTAENIFIPITVGGGVRNLEDINNVLKAGSDKVLINTAGVKNPEFISEATNFFGSSTIVISIEAIRLPDGTYQAFTDNGREPTGLDVLDWVKEVEQRGAGEIILTSVDREGTGTGFDLSLIKMVRDNVNISVIAHGGAGNISHIAEAIQDGGADAVAIASMLHYSTLKTDILAENEFKEEGNIDFIKENTNINGWGGYTLMDIKKRLSGKNIHLRTN